jgi:hypothetical protein
LGVGYNYMKVTLGLSSSDIAAQAGWSEASVEEMVRTYAHTEVGALDRIKAAYAGNVLPLRPITDAPTDGLSSRSAS